MAKEITNEQLFDLMTKMYVEFTGKFEGLEGRMEGRFEELEKRMEEGFRDLKLDNVRLENKMDKNDQALFDGYKQTYEKIIIIEDRLDSIESKLESHDVEIKVIRAVR